MADETSAERVRRLLDAAAGAAQHGDWATAHETTHAALDTINSELDREEGASHGD